METQNLNALTHLESLAAPMADMTMTITATEIQIKQEIDEITSTINDLEVRVQFIFNINYAFRRISQLSVLPIKLLLSYSLSSD